MAQEEALHKKNAIMPFQTTFKQLGDVMSRACTLGQTNVVYPIHNHGSTFANVLSIPQGSPMANCTRADVCFENNTKAYKINSQRWSTEQMMAETIAELKTTMKQLVRGHEEGTAKCTPP